MLFIPARHEALRGDPWSEKAARAAITKIADATVEAFDAKSLWPTHPRDVEADQPALPAPSLYCGATGVIWTLLRLQRDGMIELPIDFTPTIAALADHSHRFNEATSTEATSYLLGDAGVLLLQWKELRDPAAADALFALVESNLRNPTREALWGSPGTMIATLHMLDDLADEAERARWIDLLRLAAQILFDEMESIEHSAHPGNPAWIWTQDMYGKHSDYIGAGHGFAGNVYPILRGATYLDAALVQRIEARTLHTLSLVGERDGDAMNWPPHFDAAAQGLQPKPLMQDCHGAPGVVCRLAPTRSAALLDLLAMGGEATWRAGPLSKPPGLCHGTDGNGYAFLKLHKLTGDSSWLDRARAFAMHAISQSAVETRIHGQMRFSLWTGDVGLAAYLSSCVRADAAMPTLDVF